MRYSKAKMVMAGIITFVCLIAVGFGIYKGIDYSKSLTEEPGSTRVLASVSDKKETKKTTSKKKITISKKKETKNTEKKKTITKTETTKTTESKKKETTNKTITKKEETKEVKKEVEKEYDEKREGSYKVVGLKVKNKSYSKKDLEKLKDAGYSLRLDINDKGLATIAVLSINKMYEFTDDHLYDGENEIAYTYKKNKLSVTIDDYEIVFEKE